MKRLKIAGKVLVGIFIMGAGLWTWSNPEEETLFLKGGKVFTVTKGVIEQGAVLMQKGKIAAVANDLAVPRGAKVIDASACFVFPGFIDAFTNLGTTDIETIEKDSDEATSPLTPQLRIIDSLNPQNEFIVLARKTGLTAVLSAPGTGNLFSGQSAFIHLAGDNNADMVVKFPVGMHASLGEAPKMRYGPKEMQPMTRMGEAAMIRQTLVDTQGYLNDIQAYDNKLKEFEKKMKEGQAKIEDKPAAPAPNFMLQALLPVVRGELPLIILANRLDDILTALRIADEFKLKIILNGGSDAYKLKEKLAEKKIPVLLSPRAAYKLSVETGSATFENAASLQRAGIKIAFQTGSVAHLGDLISEARRAIEHGLSLQDALKALTINPAEIFGVADKVGSIDKGLSADLLVFDGNPLTSPAKLKMVLIEGRVVENFMK
jgi:imidazolonepropionase-like amidohydrolase